MAETVKEEKTEEEPPKTEEIKPLFTADPEKYLQDENDDYERKLPLDMQRVWRRMVRPMVTVETIRENMREDFQDRARDDRDDEVDDCRFD